VAVGYDTMRLTTTGRDNVAIGVIALESNTTGYYNVAVGRAALLNNSSGISNTALGNLAGDNITTGSSNIIIGAGIDAPSATANNQLNIGGWITGAAGAITVPGSLTTAGFTSTGIDDNATGTKLTISDTTITGVGAFTSTSIDATKLSGNLPAIDGSALTGVGFDSGVKMVFAQAAAPTGWTQDTSSNDAALRVVSGSGGGTGGSAGFSAPSHSLSGGSTTLSTAQMPSHNHVLYHNGGSTGMYRATSYAWGFGTSSSTHTTNQGSSSSHNHSLSGSITAPKYKDVIVATKD